MVGDGDSPGLVVAYGMGPGVSDECCGCRGIAGVVFEMMFNWSWSDAGWGGCKYSKRVDCDEDQ